MKIAFDAKRAFCNKSGLGRYSCHVLQSLLDAKTSKWTYYAYTPSLKFVPLDLDLKHENLIIKQSSAPSIFKNISRFFFVVKVLKKKISKYFMVLAMNFPFSYLQKT